MNRYKNIIPNTMTPSPTGEWCRVADVKMLGYELDGVIYDTVHNGFDAVCLGTVKRVRAELAGVESICKPVPITAQPVADERQAFEAWVHERYHDPYHVLRDINSYTWDAWQAARAALSAPQPIKDHEIAATVNELTKVAQDFISSQQLRERIAGIVVPMLKREPQPSVPDVSAMVNRFLGWKLPQDFHPDCGISFDGRKDDEWNKNKTWPVGANLFTAEQAKAMFEYVLAAAPSPKDVT
jgi:hypothetical protein